MLSDLSYMTCLRHLFISRAVTNRIFIGKSTFFSYERTCDELPCTISTMVLGKPQKNSSPSGQATKRRGEGVKAGPLKKKAFFGLFFCCQTPVKVLLA